MHQVQGGSRVGRRLLSLVTLVAAGAFALTACGADDDTPSGSAGSGDAGSGGAGSGGAGSGSSTSSGFTSPAPSPSPISTSSSTGSGAVVLGARVRCPNASFASPEPVPTTLAGVLQACRSDRGEILLKNDSALQLRVQPVGATSLTAPVRASDGFSDTLNAQLAAASSDVTAVRIPPGGYVVAYATSTAAVSARVGILLPDASQAYAASVMARYVESKLQTPPQRLAASVATCAQDAGETWSSTQQSGQADLDQLLAETALGPVLSCRKVVTEVSELTREKPPATEGALAREFKALPKGVGATVWDDLLRYVRNLVALAH